MTLSPRDTKGGSITIQLSSLYDLFGLACFANKTKIVSCHTTDSKPVKQEVNSTVILPALVFLARSNEAVGFKNVNNCLNINIYFYLEISPDQSSNQYFKCCSYCKISVN